MSLLTSALTSWLPLVNVALLIATVGAGAFVFRRQYQRGISEIQQRVIDVQREENAAQAETIMRLRTKVSDLETAIATIRLALKRRSLEVSINGESVTITDLARASATTTTISKVEARRAATQADTTHDQSGP